MSGEWNAIATLQNEGFADAVRTLGAFGQVQRSPYYNVLTMTVPDGRRLLNGFTETVARQPGILNFISHLFPAQHAFDFATAAEFHAKARQALEGRLSELAGRGFHIRIHRRGMKGVLERHEEERALASVVIAALHDAGTPARISFEDADAVVQIETIDGRAGLSVWTREELRQHPFLGAD